ncbi:MAG: FAD-dependent oxidoreductase [Comamonadaceae bacterium]|nr:MAG: FAD-dependent oxidoreductase [Comamonadaceae bacterium]
MKIAVIGAGIIGITTAYELALDGHEVTVFERRGAAAEETSFANAGLVAPGYVTPWAAPGMPSKVFAQLFKQHAPVKLSWPLSGSEISWMWKWFKACKLPTYLTNRGHMQRLAFYSRDRLHEITGSLQLEFDWSPGYTVLLRNEKNARMAHPGLQILRDAGVPFTELDADGVRKVEPALNPDTEFFGGIHLPQDDVANCRQFALLLKNEAQRIGVDFHFNAAIAKLDKSHPGGLWIEGHPDIQLFNSVVVCAGMASARLLAPLGLKIPMAAVYGYSISAAIREPLNAPRSAVMDEQYKVAISRLGNRVRVAGSAELGGSLERKNEASIQTLYKVLHDWFPGAVQLSNRSASVQEWKGARPMLPDGPPILGASGLPGLWLNLGHGSTGWAMSCGSARAVADLISGRPAAIDLQGLGVGRLTI